MPQRGMPEPGQEQMTFLLTLDRTRTEEVRDLMRRAGVDFDPKRDVFALDCDNEDVAFKDGEPVITSLGRDIEWMVPEVRTLLAAMWITPDLPPDEAEWNTHQRYSFLRTCNAALSWNDRTANFTGDAYDDKDTIWHEAVESDPGLYTQAKRPDDDHTRVHQAEEHHRRGTGRAVITLCGLGYSSEEAEERAANQDQDDGKMADCPKCLDVADR